MPPIDTMRISKWQNCFNSRFSETLRFFYDGYTIVSGIDMVDSLLIRGGLTSMLASIVLFLFALGIGGMLADAGVLEVLIASFAD